MSSLVNHLGSECRQAIDLARRALPDGQRLDVGAVADALFHGTSLKADPALFGLVRLFPEPALLHEVPPPAAVDEALKRVLLDLRGSAPVAPALFFATLMRSESGRSLLATRGASAEERQLLDALLDFAPAAEPSVAPSRPLTDSRIRLMRDLRDYGTIITEPPGPPLPGGKVVSDTLVRALLPAPVHAAQPKHPPGRAPGNRQDFLAPRPGAQTACPRPDASPRAGRAGFVRAVAAVPTSERGQLRHVWTGRGLPARVALLPYLAIALQCRAMR